MELSAIVRQVYPFSLLNRIVLKTFWRASNVLILAVYSWLNFPSIFILKGLPTKDVRSSLCLDVGEQLQQQLVDTRQKRGISLFWSRNEMPDTEPFFLLSHFCDQSKKSILQSCQKGKRFGSIFLNKCSIQLIVYCTPYLLGKSTKKLGFFLFTEWVSNNQWLSS